MSRPMTIADVERRLRAAAPDEPAVLPPLRLPAFAAGTGARLSPTLRLGAGQSAAPGPRLGLALTLLLLAAAAAVIAGSLRLLNEPPTRTNQLVWPPAQGVLGIQDGFTMEWPESWHRLAEGGLEQGDFTQVGIAYERVAIILASVQLPGCAGSTGTEPPNNAVPSGEPAPERSPNPLVLCLRNAPLPPGEVRVTVEVGERSGAMLGPDGPAAPDTSDPTREAGWTEEVDGQPARLTVIPGAQSEAAGVAETLVWDVIFPGTINHLFRFRAELGSGDVAARRAAARAVLQSIRFETRLAELDPAVRPSVVRLAIDQLDRQARAAYWSDFYQCLPREEGTVEGTISGTPWQLLDTPLDVTCETAVSESPVGLWRVSLTVRWAPGAGFAGGGMRQELFVGPPSVGGDPFLSEAPDSFFMATWRFSSIDASGAVTPDGVVSWPSLRQAAEPGGEAPVAEPGAVIEFLGGGSISEVPGGEGWAGIELGQRVLVVGGPIAVDGVDWYAVQWDDPAGSWIGWLPSMFDRAPVFGLAPARCPSGDADFEDLRWLTSGERLACFGSRDLSLDQVVLVATEPELCVSPAGEPVTCAPSSGSWRVEAASHWMFGPAGRLGPIPPMHVWLAPGIGAPPADVPLRVTGHFDDPRAARCEPADDDRERLRASADIGARLDCRVRFVITGFERVDQ